MKFSGTGVPLVGFHGKPAALMEIAPPCADFACLKNEAGVSAVKL